MALKPDQRAMLQLLLERGQSYEDIASLLGASTDQVRARARSALTELGGSDPDAEVGLTDYLLGQADPIGRADAVRHLQRNPDALQHASGLAAQLRLLAPDGDLPELPTQRGGRGALLRRRHARTPPTKAEPAAATPAASGSGATAQAARLGEAAVRIRGTLSPRQQQVIVALAASAVLVVVAVLAIAGAFGGGEESTSATNGGSSAAGAGAVEGEEILTVRLEPQAGDRASGEAVFGLATANQPYIDLSLSGLSPAGENETYVVWLLIDAQQGYPLSPLQIGADGRFSDRFPIPTLGVPIASRSQFVDVSLTPNADLASLLARTQRSVSRARQVTIDDLILDYVGDSVLRGKIPVSEQGPAGQGS
jgi:hypothetical protein